MRLRSDQKRWGTVTKALHWLSAAALIAVLAHGWWMTNMIPRDGRLWHYATHGLIGFYLALLMAIRIVWRLTERAPDFPGARPGWETALAHAGHLALYALSVALVVSGYIMWSAFPARFVPARAAMFDYSLFGFLKVPALHAKANLEVFRFWEDVHEELSHIFELLIVVHVAAALRHHYVKRNDVLRRML